MAPFSLAQFDNLAQKNKTFEVSSTEEKKSIMRKRHTLHLHVLESLEDRVVLRGAGTASTAAYVLWQDAVARREHERGGVEVYHAVKPPSTPQTPQPPRAGPANLTAITFSPSVILLSWDGLTAATGYGSIAAPMVLIGPGSPSP